MQSDGRNVFPTDRELHTDRSDKLQAGKYSETFFSQILQSEGHSAECGAR